MNLLQRVERLEAENAQLKQLLSKVKEFNNSGVENMNSGFVAFAEIQFKKATALLNKSIESRSQP